MHAHVGHRVGHRQGAVGGQEGVAQLRRENLIHKGLGHPQALLAGDVQPHLQLLVPQPLLAALPHAPNLLDAAQGAVQRGGGHLPPGLPALLPQRLEGGFRCPAAKELPAQGGSLRAGEGLAVVPAALGGNQLQHVNLGVEGQHLPHHGLLLLQGGGLLALHGKGQAHACLLGSVHHLAQPVHGEPLPLVRLLQDGLHLWDAEGPAVVHRGGQLRVSGHGVALAVEEVARGHPLLPLVVGVPLAVVAVEGDGVHPHARQAADVLLGLPQGVGGDVHGEVDVLADAPVPAIGGKVLAFGQAAQGKGLFQKVPLGGEADAQLGKQLVHAAQQGALRAAPQGEGAFLPPPAVAVGRQALVHLQAERQLRALPKGGAGILPQIAFQLPLRVTGGGACGGAANLYSHFKTTP